MYRSSRLNRMLAERDSFGDLFTTLFASPVGKLKRDVFYEILHNDDKSTSFRFELPGFSKEDVNISVENNILKLSAKRKIENSKFNEQDEYHNKFLFVSDLDPGGVVASMKDGVLLVTVSPSQKNEHIVKVL